MNVTKIVLHVGMPKTATTTLQHTFETYSQKLLSGGTLFPKTGRPCETSPNHHSLFLPVASSLDAIRTPLPEPCETFEGMVRRLEKERREAGATSILLSSEMLWNPVSFDRAALIRIRDAFPSSDFIVVVYLRPVESHALSAYAQKVTGPQHSTDSFNETVAKLMGIAWYEYDQRLDDFASVFGREAITPVWLPTLNQDVLHPFRNIFPALEDVPIGKTLNARRSWLYVAVKRRLNVFQSGPARRLSDFCLRILEKFDRLAKKFKKLDEKLNPMSLKTKKGLENKTVVMLDKIRSEWGMSES